MSEILDVGIRATDQKMHGPKKNPLISGRQVLYGFVHQKSPQSPSSYIKAPLKFWRGNNEWSNQYLL
jgi:hypothetical protein